MNYTDVLSECIQVSIYLGNTCNFDCNYCDRSYISNAIGNQAMNRSNIDHLENFFEQIYKESDLKLQQIAFHGGEPFLFVKRMDQIIERLKPVLDEHNLKVLITTNASLILENEWFLRKWKRYLRFTFSYDFIFQEENREFVDIDAVGKLCEELKIPIMWQFVMPLYDNRVFSLDVAKDIIDKSKYSAERSITLIPLRHYRGEEKFKDFFDEINTYQMTSEFMRFLNVLFSYGIRARIDGAYKVVDKKYTRKHYKIILSPDGYMYPEYDFCEYQAKDFRVGQWYNKEAVQMKQLPFVPTFTYDPDTNREDNLIHEKCRTCSVRASCGIKYLYKLFNKPPKSSCVGFYRAIDELLDYSTKLNTKDNFRDWVIPKTTMKTYDPEKFVPDATDFKSHFVKVDSILGAKQQLIFSLFRRYNCFANCQVCYTDKLFEKDKSKFSRFVPTEITQEISDRWLNLFQGYYIPSTYDDLYALKHDYPHLFKWYKNHSSVMYYSSMTDNSFVRTYDIMLNDMDRMKGIYEVAFSDEWLEKVGVKKIIAKLEKLHAAVPIRLVKYITTNKESYDWASAVELKAFLEANGIGLKIYADILHSETVVFHKIEQEVNFATYNGEIFNTLGEADYLQYDSFFLTIVDSIDPTIQPCDVLDDDFTFTRHLPRLLNGKKDVYNRFYNKIKYSTNEYDKKFAEYYKFVSENLIANDNYNFIPHVILEPHTNLYGKMTEEGWIKSQVGLLKDPNAQTVIPLYQFKK